MIYWNKEGKMVAPSILIKGFEEPFGLDLRSSHLTRKKSQCTTLLNTLHIDGFEEKRVGSQLASPFYGYTVLAPTNNTVVPYSPHRYTYLDTTSGATKEELIQIVRFESGGLTWNALARLRTSASYLQVTYSGAGSGSVFLLPLLGVWTLQVAENGVVVLTQTYSTGYSLTAANLLEQVRADIDALANWAATITSTATLTNSVGVLGPVPETTCASGVAQRFNFFEPELVWPYVENYDFRDTLTTAKYNSVGYVNPHMKNAQNVAYIAVGTYLIKYDGLRVYRAGLPKPSVTIVGDIAGATFTAGQTFAYRVVIRRYDYRNNEIVSAVSLDSSSTDHTVVAANANIRLTLANPYQGSAAAGEWYYGWVATTVNGNQVGVNTINMNEACSGHWLVGDKAYFLDGVSGAYVTRNVTAVGANSITFDGAAVNVVNGAFVSCNLRYDVYRTKDGGVDFFLVASVPMDMTNPGQTFDDSVTDANLGAELQEQPRAYDPPPKCSILALHQGKLCTAGDPDNPNTVSFSDDLGGLEAFPLASNSTDVPSTIQGPITAMESESDAYLWVFKETSAYALTGDFEGLSINPVTKSEGDIGVVSQHTLAKINDSLIGLSRLGPILVRGGELTDEIGKPLAPDFRDQKYDHVSGTAISTANEQKMFLSRAVAINDFRNRRYILWIPCFSGTPGSVAGAGANRRLVPNAYSKAYMLEYGHGMATWRNLQYPAKMNWLGGAAIYQERLFWAGVYEDGTNPTYYQRGILCAEPTTGTKYDYNDGTDPIEWKIQPQWMA
jgi:hypothetical protein